MSEKDNSIIKRISRKNLKDTIILAIVTVLIVAIMIYIDDKSVMVSYSVIILLVYFIQYQYSRNDLMKSLDKLIDNELKDFQKISTKVLQLTEKQNQLTNKYIPMLNNIVQLTKQFKNSANDTKSLTQDITSKIEETYDYANKESKSLSESILLIQKLKQKVQIIAELIIELTDYIKQIGATVSVVNNISEQTNMLALNAAVEAARAGEYGKGFAVVAGEIRKLADESKQATNKITSLVSEIEHATSSTIIATEEGAKDIDLGYKSASDVSDNINSVVNRLKVINADINDVLVASSQQQIITNDVCEKIEEIQKSTSEALVVLEENTEYVKAFAEILNNIKDNIAN